MDLGCGKCSGETLNAVVGGQMDLPTARHKFVRERFRREQMPASSPGRQKNGAFRHL